MTPAEPTDTPGSIPEPTSEFRRKWGGNQHRSINDVDKIEFNERLVKAVDEIWRLEHLLAAERRRADRIEADTMERLKPLLEFAAETIEERLAENPTGCHWCGFPSHRNCSGMEMLTAIRQSIAKAGS